MESDLSRDFFPKKEEMTLSIILVNHNGGRYIEDCLDSIRKNVKGLKSEIIVVDNHSTDGSVDMLQRRYPSIRLLSNHENVGFSRANNQGLRASTGHYVLIINTDTLVYSDSIKKMMAEMKKHPDRGGVGPALLTGKDDYQVSFGGKVNFFSETVKKLFLNRLSRNRLRKNQKKRQVEWLSAACFLSRRDVLERARGFDEQYFLYFEDIDLCMRIRERGWRLVYLPEARVFHIGGASTRQRKLNSRFHYRKSQLYFYKKHCSPFSLFLLKVFLSVNFVFVLLTGLFKKNSALKERIRFFRLLGKQE